MRRLGVGSSITELPKAGLDSLGVLAYFFDEYFILLLLIMELVMCAKNRTVALLAFVLIISAAAVTRTFAADTVYPLRAQYEIVGVKPISTQDLTANFAQYTLVDVRSEYEFQTLHIEGAQNMPLSDASFEQKIRALSDKTNKTLVFYCNGTTCAKSYDAAARALKVGVKSVWVYDAGILAWAQANPTKTDLMGKRMVSSSQLIDKANFESHVLSPRDFYEQVLADPNAIVLDIRDASQRAGVSLFQMRDVHVPLDNTRLADWIKKAKAENKAIYFIDETGHQVQWLQYFLQEAGTNQYWFMKGGAKAFFETM
jgi:rhodanese-related sulfurtransferase